MADRPPSMLDGSGRYPTFTLVRLLCLPVFLYLLFGRDNQAAAALMLGARRHRLDRRLPRPAAEPGQRVRQGLRPTADRLLFIVAVVAIMIDGSMPIWFGVAVLAREVLVGVMMVIATLVFKIERIDVTWLGKLATFLLMFAVPVSCWAAVTFRAPQDSKWRLGCSGDSASRSATGPGSRIPQVRAGIALHRAQRRLRCCTVDLLNRDTVAP